MPEWPFILLIVLVGPLLIWLVLLFITLIGIAIMSPKTSKYQDMFDVHINERDKK